MGIGATAGYFLSLAKENKKLRESGENLRIKIQVGILFRPPRRPKISDSLKKVIVQIQSEFAELFSFYPDAPLKVKFQIL